MNDISLKQLEIFVAVVEYGGFTRAAEELFFNQSTVSAHISLLEQALGKELFVRSNRRHVRLTKEGEQVYPIARRILNDCAALRTLTTEAAVLAGCAGAVSRAGRTAALRCGVLLRLRTLDGQIDAAVFINSKNLDLHALPLLQMIVNVVHIGVRDLGDVHEAGLVVPQGHKCSEFGYSGNLTLVNFSNFQLHKRIFFLSYFLFDRHIRR